MKAIGYYQNLPVSDPRSLVDIELPTPTLRPRDLLVRIEAVSVNPVDTKVRNGMTPPDGTARVLGYDAAGVVEAVGAEAVLFKVGDPVFYAGALDRPGSNAQWQAVDERLVGRKPASLDFAAAAALPLTALTAWELLFDRLGVRADANAGTGDALLIINGAGGVGSILTQIARRLTGLTVIATASRPQSIAWCKEMGAHHVIDHRQPLEDGLQALGIPDVRYVASLTATDTHLASINAVLAPQGAFAVIDDPKALDIVPFKRKSISVHWELMFTRSLFGTADMAEQHRILDEVATLVDKGVLRTTLSDNAGAINAENLRHAHARQESATSIGKTVLAGF
ncbi:zinc-binding alcohol dehydrogenase family protein [Robbsia sp. Bb-Pol-6]|uniref:Zinc-type alcohol dehydrogenase-like protein n=1 Tax=Robbsia betulipollinis TaxID=2981849 RepID=A0ABT3ZR56_9BURK|nr:zinc-binding alcohol dehydrogenase family protein [Robbsia betulipollinis]MCY0389046.1 zinc-binding alcohol dehydrogenase family protein [Robbsia betulipollinis]